MDFIVSQVELDQIAKDWIDKNIVDGLMNGLAAVTAKISSLIKGLQSGKVQNYALFFFGGVVALAVLFIYLWK